jgi:hypothetical protein
VTRNLGLVTLLLGLGEPTAEDHEVEEIEEVEMAENRQ